MTVGVIDTEEQFAPSVKWNDRVKLVISDVDETIADNYTPADPQMIEALTALLEEGIALLLVSGASVARIRSRIVDALPPHLRKQVVVAHCSGAEIWGFDAAGNQQLQPFLSVYDATLSTVQKQEWREVVQCLVGEFRLEVYLPAPIDEFRALAGDNPLAIMAEDRGPQITLEIANAFELSAKQAARLDVQPAPGHGRFDLRVPILQRAEELLSEARLPITPRLAGIWAIDFAIEGVSKTSAVSHVMESTDILGWLGLEAHDLRDPRHLEIWGDRFSTTVGGTDRHICEALPNTVRAIDFRDELEDELPAEYNIVIWDGQSHEHAGLLEYLQHR